MINRTEKCFAGSCKIDTWPQLKIPGMRPYPDTHPRYFYQYCFTISLDSLSDN